MTKVNDDRQQVLFEPTSDEALLLPAEEMRKHYTGQLAKNMEWKKGAILMLLGAGFGIRLIAEKLHVSTHTVTELLKRSASEVATHKREFAEILMSTGARWIGLARTKENGASFRDLTIGAGIVMQHARELVAISTGQSDGKEISQMAADHAERLRQLREWFDRAELGVPPPIEAPADPAGGADVEPVAGLEPAIEPRNIKDFEASSSADKVMTQNLAESGVKTGPSEVTETTEPGHSNASVDAPASAEGVGGSPDGPAGKSLMGPLNGGSSVNGPALRSLLTPGVPGCPIPIKTPRHRQNRLPRSILEVNHELSSRRTFPRQQQIHGRQPARWLRPGPPGQ
jgi:hypothetical protein